ncbi:MAG: tyrosine-type recombinase/integrase, partial [Bacteroidia bacterium]
MEKSLSANSIEAYLHDIQLLTKYLELHQMILSATEIKTQDLRNFLKWLTEMGMGASSQARILSGIKSFYNYLLLENLIATDPTELIEAPRVGRKLPDTLNQEEISLLLDQVDRSTAEGERNRAMLETLYSCGLRVSELVNLKLSQLFLDDGFVRIIGKGDKERLVPIGGMAIKHIQLYVRDVRVHNPVQKGEEDIVFLNRRGRRLTRVMVFLVIKQLVALAGI